MSGEILFRVAGMVGLGLGGWRLGSFIHSQDLVATKMAWIVSLSLGGAVLGLVVAPYLTTRPYGWARRKVSQIAPQTLLAAIVGLSLALVISALVALPLSLLAEPYGQILPVAVALLLSYLGISVMLARGREFSQLLGFPSDIAGTSVGKGPGTRRIVLDTSAIIDGRIADISSAGFITGPLLIPRFILDELQHIADSNDSLRRKRGRRGLEMLSKIQKESGVPIQIIDVDFEEIEEVDAKLVRLAKTLDCPIISNDFNLNRVAELQGLSVLNINQLAVAVKPVVLPGEEMEINIIQEGKEFGQGVGFLDDGTMVVVEGGRRYLNSQVDIVITRVLQTAVGRMIFAQLKDGADHEREGRQ